MVMKLKPGKTVSSKTFQFPHNNYFASLHFLLINLLPESKVCFTKFPVPPLSQKRGKKQILLFYSCNSKGFSSEKSKKASVLALALHAPSPHPYPPPLYPRYHLGITSRSPTSRGSLSRSNAFNDLFIFSYFQLFSLF